MDGREDLKGPWRDGRHVVVRRRGPIGSRCVVTGLETDRVETHEVEIAPRLVRWIAAATMSETIQELATRHVTLELPVHESAAELKRTGRRTGTAVFGLGFVLLAAFFMLDVGMNRWLALLPIVAIVLCAFGGCRIARPVAFPWGVRAKRDRIWLAGFHSDALAELPKWPGRRALRERHHALRRRPVRTAR